MNLKKLRERIVFLQREIRIAGDVVDIATLNGIKQTVEAVDEYKVNFPHVCNCKGCKEFREEWKKIKELLK